MENYYYLEGKQQVGPFSLSQIRDFNLPAQTLVWRTGLKKWMPASEFAPLEGYLTVGQNSPPPFPAQQRDSKRKAVISIREKERSKVLAKREQRKAGPEEKLPSVKSVKKRWKAYLASFFTLPVILILGLMASVTVKNSWNDLYIREFAYPQATHPPLLRFLEENHIYQDDVNMAFFLAACAVGVLMMVFRLRLFSLAWKQIEHLAEMSAGEVVLRLLIPVYGLFFGFKAYSQVMEHLRTDLVEHGLEDENIAKPGLSIWLGVARIGAWIPLWNFISLPFYLIMNLIYHHNLQKVLTHYLREMRSLARHKEEVAPVLSDKGEMAF